MRKVTILLSFLLITLIFPLSISAKIIRNELAIVASNEVIDDDLFIGGETVLVEGTVNGDLYVAGGNIIVKGKINGDVLAAGGMIDISGTVRGDIRAAGGNIIIKGSQIGGGLSLVGGNISIDNESSIGGGLVLGSGNANIDASVGRGLTGGVGNLLLNSSVGKDVNIGAGTIALGPSAKVEGDFNYTSDEELQADQNARIEGKITRTDPDTLVDQEKVSQQGKSIAKAFGEGIRWWSFLSSLVTGMVFLLLFKKQALLLSKSINDYFLKNLGWGLMTMVMTPILFIILFFSVLGIPLAVILAVLFAIEIYLTRIVVAVFVGNKLVELAGKKDVNIYIALILGLVVLFVLSRIPVISFITTLTVTLVGLGAIFNFKRDFLTKNRK